MEYIKITLEGEELNWEEPEISYIDFLSIAKEDTNDQSYVVEIKIIKNGNVKKELEIRYGQSLDVREYLSEKDKYLLEANLSSDGSVS